MSFISNYKPGKTNFAFINLDHVVSIDDRMPEKYLNETAEDYNRRVPKLEGEFLLKFNMIDGKYKVFDFNDEKNRDEALQIIQKQFK